MLLQKLLCVSMWYRTQNTAHIIQHIAHCTQHTAAQCCNVLCCAALCACCDLWGAAQFIHPSTAYGRLHSCTQHTAHTTHRTQDTIHNKQHTDTATRTHRWHMYPLRHRRRNKHTHTHTQTQSLREYSSKQQHIIQ